MMEWGKVAHILTDFRTRPVLSACWAILIILSKPRALAAAIYKQWGDERTACHGGVGRIDIYLKS